MHRRALALPGLLAVIALVLGACGPAAPTITDPSEILAKAVESLKGVKTVHLEATVEGTIKFDLTGTGGGDVGLTGTKLVADIDLESSELSANLAVPAMLGLTADVVIVDGASYFRSSLSGAKYTKGTLEDSPVPIDTTDPSKSLDELKAWLDQPSISPKKIDDASCGSKSCYQIEIDLTAAELQVLIPDATNLGDAEVILTVLVEKDTLRPAGLVIKAGATGMGEVTITMSLSKWDEALAISAPPADQVE